MQIDFPSDYGPQTKRAKKRFRPYTSLFLDLNTEFFKLRIICSPTRFEDQFEYETVQYILVLPYFRLVSPHFAFSGGSIALAV